MKLYSIIITSLVILILYLSSCRCGCNVERPALTRVRLVNFSQREMDSLTIKLYNPNTNFSDLTFAYTTTATGSDSSYYISIFGQQSTNPNYNFETSAPDIASFVPSDTVLYKISNITFKSELCEHCAFVNTYVSFVKGFAVNGVQMNGPEVTITK